jgi:tol-pal system protein YbgF
MVFVLSSCLKTRRQIRDEPEEDLRPTPVQPVQDVQPQGQYVIDEIKSEITRLVGRVEDLERQANEPRPAPNAEELKRLEARVAQLETAQTEMLESAKKASEPKTASPEELNELFKKAKGQFEDLDYENSAETFAAYLKSPKAKRVEEATFLRGEAYLNLKQHKKAIVEYSKISEKFPHSSKMPEVLYKIGLCFDALGMKEDSKGFYQEVVDKYPKSNEAKKAKKKLK